MKKFITTICLIYVSLTVCAQSRIYVIYSAVNNSSVGIVHRKMTKYNTNLYRSAPHIFTIQNPNRKYYFRFTYLDAIGAPHNAMIAIPDSQLNRYETIYWDEIAGALTEEQAKEKVEYILSHDTIYFMDKNERQPSYFVAIPVKPMEANY